MDWITDRLPTESDADSDGHVLVQRSLHAKPRHGGHFHWQLVRPGMGWTHTCWWRPPAAKPAKPALAVGQRWRRGDGAVVTVDRYDRDHEYGETHSFWADGISYTADGIFAPAGVAGSYFDLVDLIEPAAEPAAEPTHRRFVSISRTAWMAGSSSHGHTLDAIADDGTAWWMVPGETEWQQLPALPAREVQTDA